MESCRALRAEMIRATTRGSVDPDRTLKEDREYAEALLAEAEELGDPELRDAGILTNNEGIVVQLTDGSEFQITIVRSRP